MSNIIQFHDAKLNVIDHNGQKWLTAKQISAALGYDKEEAVTQIYSRHKDEFNGDSQTLKLKVNGRLTLTRVFNRNGARLVAMLAKTKVAKEFRAWVIKALADYTDTPKPEKLPVQQQLPLAPMLKDMDIYHMRSAFIFALNIGEETKAARAFLADMPYSREQWNVEQHLQSIGRMADNLNYSIKELTKLLPGGTPKTKQMIEHLIA